MVLPIKITSWNIRGISSPAKRTKILNHLYKLISDICFLQETHLTEAESQKLKAKWISQIFHFTYSSKKRGVSILIGQNVPFFHNSTLINSEGHYIIINGTIGKEKVTLANTYGPNIDTPSFFHSLFSKLLNCSDSIIILGGDFNTVLDADLDRSSIISGKLNYSSSLIKHYVSDCGLIVIWRLKQGLLLLVSLPQILFPYRLFFWQITPSHIESLTQLFMLSLSLTMLPLALLFLQITNYINPPDGVLMLYYLRTRIFFNSLNGNGYPLSRPMTLKECQHVHYGKLQNLL
ncbi:hypothetical protein LDENG_00211650 [Lucifuga dentata]|nr:hypothetical protein LDENG_00211650 [Lucifuga dentata]